MAVKSSSDNNRAKIVAAALSLAATRPWREIGLREIAAEAKLGLGEVVSVFPSKTAILGGAMAATDRDLLDAMGRETLEERPIDRLFDVVMKRLELLAPHKAALRNILSDVAGEPLEQLCLAGPVLASQRRMLIAADIDVSGAMGMVRAKGLALLYARVLGVWVDDDDPGLARTMAALDRELRRGERWLRALDAPLGICRAFARLGCVLSPLRPRRRYGPAAGSAGEAPPAT